MFRLLAFLSGLSFSIFAVPAGAASVMERLQEDGNLSIFATAVQKAGLGDRLSGPGQITVFVPSNRAMRNEGSAFLLESVLLSDGNEGRLSDVVSHHVVQGLQLRAGAIAETKDIDTLSRSCLRIERFGSALKVGPEAVVTKRLAADNGVILIVDRMLWAPWQNASACEDSMLQVGSAS